MSSKCAMSKGGADVFPCVLCGVPEPPAPAVNRIAHRPAFLLEVLDRVGAVPPEPPVEHLDELGLGDAAPVAAVEELVLQVAEEALAGRVVGRVALPRHRAGDAVRRADPLPARPAVMAAAVGVAEGVLPGPQLRARGQQRGVRELGVRAPRDRPAHGLAVEQVDDRREVDLGRVGELELDYVGRPLLAGRVGAEVVGEALVEGCSYSFVNHFRITSGCRQCGLRLAPIAGGGLRKARFSSGALGHVGHLVPHDRVDHLQSPPRDCLERLAVRRPRSRHFR